METLVNVILGIWKILVGYRLILFINDIILYNITEGVKIRQSLCNIINLFLLLVPIIGGIQFIYAVIEAQEFKVFGQYLIICFIFAVSGGFTYCFNEYKLKWNKW